MNFYLISNSFKSFYLFRKDIIRKLSKKYNIILIANSDSYSNYFEKKNKITCVKLNNVFNNKSIFKNIIFSVRLIYLFSLKKPYIVQTYTIHPNILCIPIAKLFFAKTSAMITGMGATSITRNSVVKNLINFFYKLSFSFCDHLFFVNSDNEKFFKLKLGLKKKSTRIFGAGVSKKKLILKQNFIKNKYNLYNTFNILFLGRIIKEKGVIDLIKIFKLLKIKNKKLIFIGDIDRSGFSQNINKKIFNYPNIIFLGHIKDAENYYDLANLFILPSYTEGMPTTLMEAIKYKVPTLTYKIPGVIDVIKDNMNGCTVNPGEINQMINKIYKIYNNKSYRLNLINNSNKTLIKFDRNKIIDKVYNVYENL